MHKRYSLGKLNVFDIDRYISNSVILSHFLATQRDNMSLTIPNLV